MRKTGVILLSFMLCFLFIFVVMSFMAFLTKTEYSTRGAVTYFDDRGQYQLINSVGEDYVMYNAKEEKFFGGFILYYLSKGEKVYLITNPNKTEIVYAILDTDKEIFVASKNIEDFVKEEQYIFKNKDYMVDLTIKHNQYMKNILKFMPQKWRKW